MNKDTKAAATSEEPGCVYLGMNHDLEDLPSRPRSAAPSHLRVSLSSAYFTKWGQGIYPPLDPIPITSTAAPV